MSCGTKGGEIHFYPPLQAIRRKCLDCCCGSPKAAGLCSVQDCALYPYRFGHNPKRKGVGGPKKRKNPNSASDFSTNSLN